VSPSLQVRAGPFAQGFDVTPAPPSRGGYGRADAPTDAADLAERMRRLFAVWDHPKPVIAAVHGHCIGAGTVLAVLADITVVTDTASIGVPSLPLGGGFLTPTWVHLVVRSGRSCSHSRPAPPSTAPRRWPGLGQPVGPEDRLADEVGRLAENIARTPAGLLVLKKAAINRMVELGGLRTGAMIGALTDAVAHQVPELDAARLAIRERGVRQAVEDFRSGALDL